MADKVKPENKRRFRRFIIVLGLMLVAGGGWWLWQYLSHYQVVARFPCDSRLIVLDAGFLTGESWHHFTFRDWRGGVRWQVAIDSVNYWYDKGWGRQWFQHFPCAIAPDGQTFAAISTVDGRQMRLGIWRNGRLVGRLALPYQDMDVRMWVLTDGRVLLSGLFDDRPAEVMIVEKGRVVASASGFMIIDLSPDGSVASVMTSGPMTPKIFFAQPIIKQGTIFFANKLTFTMSYSDSFTLLNHGMLLETNGTLYRNGRLQRSFDLEVKNIGTSAGVYVLSYYREKVKVLDPLTGKQWSVKLSGVFGDSVYAEGILSAAMTGNGNVVAFEYGEDLWSRWKKMLDRWPALTSRLPDRWSNVVAVYRRPGRLVSRMILDPGKLAGSGYAGSQWYPSPDARHLLAYVESVDNKTQKRLYRVVLMRRFW